MANIPDASPTHDGTISLSLSDYASILRVLTWALPTAVLSSISGQLRGDAKVDDMPLKTRLERSMMKGIQGTATINVLRKISDPSAKKVLSSVRYRSTRDGLYQPIRRDDFRGYWIYRGSGVKLHDPKDCDLILLYIHGGGYALGHPADTLTENLVMAETFESRQISVAIFSLDYTLAPEAHFPVQVEEALASYRYIVQELGVDPSKIVLMGESAGGHLALSLLIALRHDADKGFENSPEESLPKPATVVLNSPWIDLLTKTSRASVLERTDFLSKQIADSFAQTVLQDCPADIRRLYEDLAAGVEERGSWLDIMPRNTLIYMGGDELFRESIELFVQVLERSGCQVDLNIAKGQAHTWQGLAAIKDRSKFLSKDRSDDGGILMASYKQFVYDILKIV